MDGNTEFSGISHEWFSKDGRGLTFSAAVRYDNIKLREISGVVFPGKLYKKQKKCEVQL